MQRAVLHRMAGRHLAHADVHDGVLILTHPWMLPHEEDRTHMYNNSSYAPASLCPHSEFR